MTLQSKSFTINKGGTLEVIAQFLEQEIGLNAFLIRGIKGVALSTDVTQLTVLYEKYAPDILDSIAPREGALFTSGVSSDDFDVRFLFNEPVDARSISSNTFSIDGQNLTADKVYVDPGANGYFVKISASGANFQDDAFHTYQVNDSLKRQDGSSYDYTPVGGYIFHGISSAHLGDYPENYISRRRGKVAVGVVKLSKNINPQQGISEFLSQKQLSDNRLITYTPISSSTNTVDVYFIYVKTLEPQIISGFPLDNSLLPDVSAPNKVTFVFNTELDSSKLAATTGLFSIEEGFTTSTEIPPSDITLLPDRQTVEIDTSSYFNSQRVYSILARPGIRSLEGLNKEKPEQWTIHIAPYEASGGISTGVSQADFDDFRALFDAHTGDGSIHYETGDISLSTGQIPDLPPIPPDYGPAIAVLSGLFTGHSGETGIHYTQNEISISVSQVNDFDPADYATFTGLSGHTGETGIHFLESDISHFNISDIGSNTHSDIDTHIDSSPSIHFTEESISIDVSQVSNATSLTLFAGHTGDTDNPHNVTTAQIGAATQSEVDTNTSNISDNTTAIAANSGDLSSHEGDPTIHFTISSQSASNLQDVSYVGENMSSGDALVWGALGGTQFEVQPFSVTGLMDTNLSSVSNDQVLTYNSTNGKWENADVPGADNPVAFNDLTDVTIDTSFTSSYPTGADVTSITGHIVAWNGTSGEWTDFQLLPGSPLTLDAYQGADGTGPALGGNTLLLGIQDVYTTKANNLSDVSDKDEARRNLKTRYQIEDFTTTTFLSTQQTAGSNTSSYIYRASSSSFMASDPATAGVYTASSNNSSNVGTDAIYRYSQRAFHLTEDLEYYFRVGINRTTNINVRFGFFEEVPGSSVNDPDNGVFFEFNSSIGTDWMACTASGGTTTKVTAKAGTANQWEWLGFMLVSSGVYFFDYDNGTTSDESDAIAFIGATGLPASADRSSSVFIQAIANGGTFSHMWIDKFAYPLYIDYLPSGLAERF